MYTNRIPTDDNRILDIYCFVLEQVKDYLRTESILSDRICPRLTRQLVKDLFMPLRYGKKP